MGGRLGEGWRVIKAFRLDIALLRRWTARRTWKPRNDSEIGKPFSRANQCLGASEDIRKGELQTFM